MILSLAVYFMLSEPWKNQAGKGCCPITAPKAQGVDHPVILESGDKIHDSAQDQQT